MCDTVSYSVTVCDIMLYHNPKSKIKISMKKNFKKAKSTIFNSNTNILVIYCHFCIFLMYVDNPYLGLSVQLSL